MAIDIQEVTNAMQAAFENVWKELDASRNRELELQFELAQMVLKCETLSSKKEKIEEVEDDSELGQLTKYKHIILKERDRLQHENTDLQRRLKMDRIYREQVDKRCEDAEDRADKIQKILDAVLLEKINLQKQMKKVQEDFDESKEINKDLMLKCRELESKLQENIITINKISKDLDIKRADLENFKKNNDSLTKELLRTKNQLANAINDKNLLQQQHKDLKIDLKERIAELSKKATKLKKCEDDYNNMVILVSKKDKQIANSADDNLKLKRFNQNLEKKILELAGKYENLNKLKDNVTHERDSLRSDLLKLNNSMSDLKLQNKLKDNIIDNLKLNIEKLNIKLQDAQKNISQIIKEKLDLAQGMTALENQIYNLKDQLQSKSDKVTALNAELNEKQAEYVKIQKQLEITNTEKIILQNSLRRCSEEKSNLKDLLSKTKYQITQLDEEISSKQFNINALNYQIEKLRTEKQEIEKELRNSKNLLQSIRVELKEMKEKNNNLTKIIDEDQKNFRKLSIDLQEAEKTKNLIGEQMISRNDEVVLLKDTIKIYEGTINQGKMLYEERIEDIRLLKIEVGNLKNQKDLLLKSVANTADMRKEIIKLQRDLVQERVKNAALVEDLNTPTNVHRWRLLPGFDPDRYELLEKVQILQKQNLKLQADYKKKEDLLNKSYEDNLSLKVYMEKLPSNDLKIDLMKSQELLKTKEKKMKALAAEITVLTFDVEARDCEIKKLKNILWERTKSLNLIKKCDLEAHNEKEIAKSFDICREI